MCHLQELMFTGIQLLQPELCEKLFFHLLLHYMILVLHIIQCSHLELLHKGMLHTHHQRTHLKQF